MFTVDIEAIRQRIVSSLAASEEIKRKADRIIDDEGRLHADAINAIKDLADLSDRVIRELYHLLPEYLRPTGILRPQKPREPQPEAPNGRENPGPTPGGPIPREVRWPNWTVDQVLALADAFHEKHGKWPNKNSGRISDTSPDTWTGIDIALKNGNRNLPGGTTLARLLAEQRGVRNRSSIPILDIEMVLVWADAHHARTQSWPTLHCGPVVGAPGETWSGIDHALRRGNRGVPIQTSLPRLLAERRGVPNHLDQEDLTVEQILAWADAHQARTGRWPTRAAGDIPEAPHENWARINNALIQGNRSLPGGSSLPRLLADRRGVRNRKALPVYEIEALLLWADRHYEHHGRWPSLWSGKIEDAPGETWNAVDAAFKASGRGLAGCGYRSLAHLLEERRGALLRRGNRPAERVLPGAR